MPLLWQLLFVVDTDEKNLTGSDTTSTTISATLSYLANHPNVRNQVETEVRTAFTHGKEEVRDHFRSGKCPLLQACIWEALRMSPPLAAPQWREAPAEGILIDEVLIPGGCEIGSSIYALHRSREFDRPEVFDPYRWSEGDLLMSVTNVPLHPALRPFGAGRRSCIGRSFALEMIFVVVARIILRYDIRPTGDEMICKSHTKSCGSCHEYLLKSHLTATGSGPWLRFSRHGS